MSDPNLLGIVYDHDGTLVDNLSINYERMSHCFKVIKGIDVLPEAISTPTKYIELFDSAGNYSGNYVLFWKALGFAEPEIEEVKKLWNHINVSNQPRAYDGISRVLKATSNFQRAIFSQNGSSNIENDLISADIYNYFIGYPIIGYQESSRPKPHHGIITDIVREWRVEGPGVVLVVGDQGVDILTARYAAPFLEEFFGITLKAVVAGYGYPNQGIKNWGHLADYRIKSPRGIIDIIRDEFPGVYEYNEDGILV